MHGTDAPDDLDALPGVLQEWADIVAGAVQDHAQELDPALAARAAREAVMRIAEEFGGTSTSTYLNKGHTARLAVRLDARDREILEKFNGRNFAELSREYRLAERHIRRLVKRAAAIETARRQNDMFEGREVPTRR